MLSSPWSRREKYTKEGGFSLTAEQRLLSALAFWVRDLLTLSEAGQVLFWKKKRGGADCNFW